MTMAEAFADQFSVSYADFEASAAYPHQEFSGVLGDISINESVVAARLLDLDVNSSMGPDNIHPLLLRSCPSLVRPLYLIFAKSLEIGRLAGQWKESEIVPLFKKGVRYELMNYRQVSLTSICCKTLEREISDHIYSYCEVNNLFSKDQFGFRKLHTVEDQLLLTYDKVSEWLDSSSVVDVVLFDFSKAFDRVSHSVLLDKLSNLGIGGRVLSWLADFLTGRVMRVCVSGVASGSRSVGCGVPQGSVLGPLLFLIFVNHLPHYIKSKCKIFADDLKIYMEIGRGSHEEMSSDLFACQSDIDKLSCVSSSWGLLLNVDKCVTIRFQRGIVGWEGVTSSDYFLYRQVIQRVSSHRDLGIIIDNQLKFHEHIRSIVSKTSGLSANILKSTICRDVAFMMPVFLAHVRPILEFGSCAWNTGYIGDLKLLEGVQRRWTKKIHGLEDMSYLSRLRYLNLFSVKGRLLRADIIKCWKIFHDKCSIAPSDMFVLPSRSGLRGHKYKLAHRLSHIECRKRFFTVRIVSVWNGLPSDVVELDSLSAFKNALAVCLGDALFDFAD